MKMNKYRIFYSRRKLFDLSLLLLGHLPQESANWICARISKETE